MADPLITQQNLNASRVLVGPKKEVVRGNAADFWTLEPTGDEGGVMQGYGGDAMLYNTVVNTYTLTLNLQPTSSAIGVILKLARNGAFDISIEMNDFSFVGYATLINRGAPSASTTPTPRTITLACVYVSGNIDTGVGQTLSSS